MIWCRTKAYPNRRATSRPMEVPRLPVSRVMARMGILSPHASTGATCSAAPPLARALARDTTYTIWLFVRPGVALDTAAARVAQAGGLVRTTSRWLHAVSASASRAPLLALVRDPVLRHVQPMGRWRLPHRPDPAPELERGVVDCGTGGDPVLGQSEMPYRQLHLRPLVDAGF